MKTSVVHAYNKEVTTSDTKKTDKLLGPLQKLGATTFCKREFHQSLKVCINSVIVYVGHIGDIVEGVNQLDFLTGKLRSHESVFIRVSSVGRNCANTIDDKLVILELRPEYQSLNEDDWTEIISEAKQYCGLRKSVERQTLSDRLNRYFCMLPTFDILPALAILCQGYLIVQCGPDADGGFRLETRDSNEFVGRALGRMGWGAVVGSADAREVLPISLSGSEPAARNELRQMVADASFWDVFGASMTGDLCANVKMEWNALPSGGNWKDVQELVEILIVKKTPGLDAGLVAKAYLALAERLGGLT